MNDLMRPLVAAIVAFLVGGVGPSAVSAPAVTKKPGPGADIPSPSTTSTTIPKPNPVPPEAKCPQVWATARSVGWPETEMVELDRILYRESRCLPQANNPNDPNGGSIGLMQINRFWCKPSRWYPDGYLQKQKVLLSCEDLYNPIVNLTAGLVIYKYSEEVNFNGWLPWRP